MAEYFSKEKTDNQKIDNENSLENRELFDLRVDSSEVPLRNEDNSFNPDRRYELPTTYDATEKESFNPDRRVESSKKFLNENKDTTLAGKENTSEKSNETDANKSELTPKQTEELLDKGVSPGIIKNITFEKGVFKISSSADKFAGEMNPETGVKYVTKTVDLFGSKIEATFAEFKSVFTAQLPSDKLKAKDGVQFRECNNQLKNAVENDPKLKSKFNFRQLEQIKNGNNPSGYTWHHNEETGVMELVETDVHSKTDHIGGKAIWGGGNR